MGESVSGRITLTVHDERGKEVPFSTEVKIPMQEPIFHRPSDTQAPPGQPPMACSKRPSRSIPSSPRLTSGSPAR